ncbi:MAG: hypothetical protein JSV82_02095 [Planctomycetota bacterium]|nr:MAG: hypothetical protein JSV82_02095 [Planctomycetota bacterium]
MGALKHYDLVIVMGCMERPKLNGCVGMVINQPIYEHDQLYHWVEFSKDPCGVVDIPRKNLRPICVADNRTAADKKDLVYQTGT